MEIDFKNTLKKFANPKFSAAYVAKLAILTAIAFLLYAFVKFSLPFMFPSFLDMQISELPALLAGFSMGPVSGCLVIVFKCLLKFPMSGTSYVGEITDILMGISLVLPASIIYHIKKDRKHAFIGLAVGTAVFVAMGLVINRFISIPFYAKMFGFDTIVRMLSALYKNITADNFYTYYLLLGVLPFNVLRCIIVSLITFLLYKRLSVLLHWEGKSLHGPKIYGEHKIADIDGTYALAAKIADILDGGEIILLDGELGAGKTTFTKGLAKALGVTEEVTSPTFTILNVYESGRLRLNHLDMYRVESADELAELGIEDCMDDESVTVVEWNKFENLDGKILRVSITADGESRIFNVSEWKVSCVDEKEAIATAAASDEESECEDNNAEKIVPTETEETGSEETVMQEEKVSEL